MISRIFGCFGRCANAAAAPPVAWSRVRRVTMTMPLYRMLPDRHTYYLNRLAPTPMVQVQLERGQPAIWCKLEFLNPSGSTKDRIARYILAKAWREGRLGPGDCVIEASSG